MSSQPTLIAGRYEIDTLIGRGGMGDVYRGTDTHTGHLVAIKLLHASIVLDNPDLVDRFQREGEALGQLNHPNIVKLLGGVEEGDKHYLIMEYVGGGSLRDLLDDQSRLPLEAVLNIALDLADALTRAHRLNIIHRDIKPDNVLLAEDATPRLTDFGVAHLGDRTRLTQTGSVIGTYAYLSPEACNGLELDERADIWSFGVMLYEMLAGRVPFQENSTAAVITAILTKPAPDLLRLRPGLPEALVALIIKMLEKDRDRRISSVRLVGAELEAIIRGLDTPLRSLIATIQEKAGSSRFTTPPEGEQDVPAMARSDPHQTHGLSLYPTPGGGTPAAVTPPGSRTPPEGVVLYTADGIPVTTQTMAPAAFKIKWIALTLIVTVLACTGLIALALILDLGNRSDDGEQDSDVLIPDGTFEVSVPGETNPLMAAVEPVEPGEYMVLVAQVENQAGVVHPDGMGSGDISRAITSDLRENLERTVAFSNIRVRSYPRVITSEEEALAAAEQNGAAVVVWGNHTVDEVELNIQIGSLAPFKYIQFEREVLDRTANVRVTMTNARTQS
ncbi:MAG: serine/threonine protein kinase, partial [Chloroflexi bacterium]|nr:serine/threonine protein kinase [Chloroflexota bacterium]